MINIRKGYVDIAEGQIHYRSAGTGESLLLIHQAPMSSEDYQNALPFLAVSYRAIAVDLPGHGNSDDPPYEYEIEDYADSVINFLDAMNIAKTSIAGHHTGALIATEVAVRQPERLDKLVLSGCPVWEPDQWERHLNQPMPRDIPMTADGKAIMMTWKTFKMLSGHSDPEQWFGPFVIGLKARTRPFDAHWAAARYQVKPKLRLVTCPTLVLSGTRDYFYNELESTRSMIPNAIAGVIEDGGVFTSREQPEAFAKAVLRFLDSNKGTTGTMK